MSLGIVRLFLEYYQEKDKEGKVVSMKRQVIIKHIIDAIMPI